MTHRVARLLVPALFIVAAAAGLTAQAGSQSTQPETVPQQPPIRVGANFVRVDAYPTKGGQPVTDLTVNDFEVLEDGKPQKIDTFEHIVVRASIPQEMRAEPNTVDAAKQLAGNARNRVFLVFLDAGQVTVESSWRIREPLIRLIDRILGPDDLVGIMTPRMAASDIVLARKTQVIASGLRDIWPWGVRNTIVRDEREALYDMCYPPTVSEGTAGNAEAPVVKEMIARRRERMTLEALTDLVRYLHTIREERKAILTVTEGWLLYRPNQQVTQPRVINPYTGETEPPPMVPPPHVDPWGRLTVRNTEPYGVDRLTCDSDRQQLANIDDWQYMLDLIGEANRGNASFYTIDPAGLRGFDTDMGPEPPAPLELDRAMLKSRLYSSRMLAENTDGLAVQDTNNLDKGLRRISDDLSSYYLLGYYSTNTNFDGRFRKLTVRVKRSGVDVRARRGYRAATMDEVRSARAAANAPVSAVTATVKTAIAALSRIRPDARFVVSAAAIPGENVTNVWVAGELPASADAAAMTGATAEIEVAGTGASGSGRATLASGQRAFLVAVPLRNAQPGPIDVRVRLAGTERAASSLVDSVRIDNTAGSTQALLFRRGLSTGNRLQPAADARFSRTERVHVEIAASADVKPGAGRLLDREGKPLEVPVTVGERTDAQSGQRWITGDVILAALGAGDYAIEVGVVAPSGEQKVVTAIRVGK